MYYTYFWIKYISFNLFTLRKICVVVLVFVTISINSQTTIDSLNNVLLSVESSEEEIDIRLKIATIYTSQQQDSANAQFSLLSKLISANPNIGTYTKALFFKNYGEYLWKNSDSDSAITTLRTSYSLMESIDSTDDMATINIIFGNIYYSVLSYDSALYYFNLSLGQIDTVANKRLLAANLNNLANVYDAIGDSHKSLKYYLKALTIFKNLGETNNQAIALNNIGIINLDLGDAKSALQYLLRAAKLNSQVNNQYELSSNYGTIGMAYREMGDFDSALYYTKKEFEIATKSGFEILLARANHNMGDLHIEMGEYEKAYPYIQKSFAICRENEIINGQIFNYVNMAKIYSSRHKYDIADKQLQNALALRDSFAFYSVDRDLFLSISENYESWGKYQHALSYYQKYETIRDSLYDLKKLQELKSVQAKYETEQRNLEYKMLEEKNKLQENIISKQYIIIVVASLLAVVSCIGGILLIINRKKRKEQIALLIAKNKKIRDQSVEINAANETKARLFSIIAHDLRSPFTALMGFSELLLEDSKSGNYDRIHDNSKNLNATVNKTFELLDNLLNWSRSQQNKISPNLQNINLWSIVNEIISSFEIKAEQKQISIHNNIPKDFEIVSDKNMIIVIIRNLISNAVKYTNNSGNIYIEVNTSDDRIVISVKDTGVGISEDQKKQILSGKNEISTDGTENEQGSGLGLLIVKDFVKRLGGHLNLESSINEGTRFSLSLKKVII